MVGVQKADGDEQGPNDQGRNSHLGFSNSVVLSSVVSVDLIQEPCTNHGSDDEPDAETNIGDTGGSDSEPVGVGEEFW